MAMDDNNSLERSKNLLDIAVRNFVPPSPGKHQTLAPFRDQIASLRAKGASYRIITALLQSADIKVSHETVARFCRDVIGENTGRHKRRKPSRNNTRKVESHALPEPMSQSLSTASSEGDSSVVKLIQQNRDDEMSPTLSVPRSKGPRIADPNNV